MNNYPGADECCVVCGDPLDDGIPVRPDPFHGRVFGDSEVSFMRDDDAGSFQYDLSVRCLACADALVSDHYGL